MTSAGVTRVALTIHAKPRSERNKRRHKRLNATFTHVKSDHSRGCLKRKMRELRLNGRALGTSWRSETS